MDGGDGEEATVLAERNSAERFFGDRLKKKEENDALWGSLNSLRICTQGERKETDNFYRGEGKKTRLVA